MLRNRHDTWKLFCEDHRDILAATGLPAAVIRAEHRFRDLLEAGHVAIRGAQTSLGELTADQWSALYQFAKVFFREFESFAPEDLFPAFRREVQRRGDVFPRGIL